MNQSNQTQTAIVIVIFLVVSIMVAGLLIMFTGSLGGQVYETAESDINEIGVNYVTDQSFLGRNSTYVDNQSFMATNNTFVSLNHRPVVNTTGNKWIVYNDTGVVKTQFFTVNLSKGEIKLHSQNRTQLGGHTMTIHYQYGNETPWVDLGNSPIINSGGNEWAVVNTSGIDKTANFTMNLTTGKINLKSAYYTTLSNQTFYATYQYGNETIRSYIKTGIIETFHSQAVIAGYLPLVGLAIIIVVIIVLVVANLVGVIGGSRESGGSLF